MITVNPRPPGLRYLYVAVAGHAFAWYCLYNLFVLWLTKHYGEAVAQQWLICSSLPQSYLKLKPKTRKETRTWTPKSY